ncbi:unnamed protein product [Brassica oleracea]
MGDVVEEKGRGAFRNSVDAVRKLLSRLLEQSRTPVGSYTVAPTGQRGINTICLLGLTNV